MASKKITQLTAAVVLALGDVFAVVNSSETKKVKAEDLIGTVFTEVVVTRASLVTDKGKRLKSASVTNYTVTKGVHAAGDKIDFFMSTTGLLTLVQGSNVTINVISGKGLKMNGQYSQAVLICESTGATDVFTFTGEITA